MKDFLKKYLFLTILLFLLFMIILPHSGHDYDSYCWRSWAEYIYKNSLGQVYHSGTDYLPLYHYILALFSFTQKSFENIEKNIYLLKGITLVFHFISTFFLILYIRKKDQTTENIIFKSLFYLLNITVLYNTIIWGQIDEILTCFVFISFYFAFRKRVLFSLIFLLLALNLKMQSLIFLPGIGLALLPIIISRFSIKNILIWIFIPLIIQFSILSPFIFQGTLDELWKVVTGSVGKYPFVSMNAYNLWHLIISGDLMIMKDNAEFMAVSYKKWGLLFFFITSIIALYPLLKQSFISILHKKEFNFPIEKSLIIFAIIPLLFFFFNTQMHERYSHPAFIFLIGYSLYYNRYFVSIIGCLAYFLNMEDVLRFLELHNYGTLIFNRDFIASLYLITIILLYSYLFDFKIKYKFR